MINIFSKGKGVSSPVASRLALGLLFLVGAGCALLYGEVNSAWFFTGSSAGSFFLAAALPNRAEQLVD